MFQKYIYFSLSFPMSHCLLPEPEAFLDILRLLLFLIRFEFILEKFKMSLFNNKSLCPLTVHATL